MSHEFALDGHRAINPAMANHNAGVNSLALALLSWDWHGEAISVSKVKKYRDWKANMGNGKEKQFSDISPYV